MPSLAELLGIAPFSDVAIPYVLPSPASSPVMWPRQPDVSPWPFVPSGSAFAPAPNNLPLAGNLAYSGGGILGDHPIVRDDSLPPSGGILGDKVPALPGGAPPTFSNLAFNESDPAAVRAANPGVFGRSAAAPTQISPTASVDSNSGNRPQTPDPYSAASGSGDVGELRRTIQRAKDEFSDAYAAPLGPGSQWRKSVEPLTRASGTWVDAVNWPARAVYQALLLDLPTLGDAMLRLPRPVYDLIVDALVEHGVSLGLDRGDVESLGRDLKAMPEAFAGAPASIWPSAAKRAFAPTAPPPLQLTGQIHHAIPQLVYDELQKHPILSGVYRHRDPRLETQAIDLDAHKGYQTWHRELDIEVADYVRRHPDLTQEQFEDYLRARYAQPDLKMRFPNGL